MIYRSNLQCPDLSPYFKLLSKPRAYSIGHDVPSDPDYEPDCGYWTHDEAAILYNVASRFQGVWVDLGCRFGWTTAHLALAGCDVVAVDPVLAFEMGQARFERNLRNYSSGIIEVSHHTVQDWATRSEGCIFNGFVIDADHDPPQPLLDAQACVNLCNTDDCVIMLHDFMGRPIQEAVEWLLDEGYHCRIYDTPNMVACCWRGDFTPPVHVADPAIDWAFIRRAQFPDFDFSRTE